jgi:hypothetical protein
VETRRKRINPESSTMERKSEIGVKTKRCTFI